MDNAGSKKRAIAERAREARRLSGLSQGQVAAKMGWHRPTVSQIESADRALSATEATELASLYDVSLAWLLAEENEDATLGTAKIHLAARELEKLKPEDLDRLLHLLQAMRQEERP